MAELDNHKLLFAVLSPPGRAAIATIAVWGDACWQVAQRWFRRRAGKLPDLPQPGRFWFGKFGTDALGHDEVVLAVKQTAPVPCIEIHCHGGIEVVRLIRDLIRQAGGQETTWAVFVEQMTANPLQAAAAIAVTQAMTLRTAGILLDQYHGAFARELSGIRAELQAGNRGTALVRLAELVKLTGLGRHLTTPWRVVIAGAPNAGKSSLINALAGYERSIVSPQSGTTRDLVTTTVAIDGWPVELIDTAGVRSEAEPVEREGIDRARGAAREADLCLWLIDSSTAPVIPEPQQNLQIVISKTDLPAAWDSEPVSPLRISVQTGAGMAALQQFVSQRLAPIVPKAGGAVPFTRQLCDEVEAAYRLCTLAKWEEALATLDTAQHHA